MKKEGQKWVEVFGQFYEHLRIKSKEVGANDERGTKLELWTSQKRFLEEVCAGMDRGVRTFYCLKARQLGVTTISLAFDVFFMAMYPGNTGCLVTESEGNSVVFRNMIRDYVESFPKGFFGKKFSIVKDNRSFMQFSNGSRLDFLVAGTRKKTTWSEGRAYAFAHVTEVAKYGSVEGLNSFKETLAEQNPNRLFIYESTALGFNHWHAMWEGAKTDKFTKHGIFLGWWSKDINRIEKNDPRYAIYGAAEPDAEERKLIDAVERLYDFKVTPQQLAWYRWRHSSNEVTQSQMDQNQPWTESEAFISSGISFFQLRVLDKEWLRITEGNEFEEPYRFEGFRYYMGSDFHEGKMERITTQDRIHEVTLRVWEQPVKDAEYVIGCDPAYGRNDHKDRHAISVWRCFADRLVQVAEYADNTVETACAAWVLAFLAGTYRNCEINIELTGGPGKAVMREWETLRDRMRTDMYANVVQEHEWDDFLSHARWYLYNKVDSYGGSGKAKGWESTASSKWNMCNLYRDSHSSGLLVIKSRFLVEEMQKIVQDGSYIGAPGADGGGPVGGSSGAKDDRVFAAMLANLAWKERIRPRMVNENYTYDMVMAQESGESSSEGAIINNIIHQFLKRAEERENLKDDRPYWLVERGLA